MGIDSHTLTRCFLNKNNLLETETSFLLIYIMRLTLQYSDSYKDKLDLKSFTLS